ncbi:hypothetical protein A9Q98_05570 [Thalassotalea sp. 42_200_T64]|mgnify:CR=1 FL=1|nr:hypothetical protein A9Q98_05570 [Thalassotalea sp. 42_200_T64]
MKKSVKAALLSALVYPGMGHFFLKKYAVCAIFSCTFSVPLYFIISGIITKAEHVVEQIKNGEIPLDIAAISESLSRSIVGVDVQELNIKMYVLVVIWLIAIIDSYRLGHAKT